MRKRYMLQQAALRTLAFVLLTAVLANVTTSIAVAQVESASSWPQFRGPDGQGHSIAKNVPIEWSEKENIEWKVPIPGEGWSSPVLSGNQIWLTYALDDGKSLHAICVDANSGAKLHDIEIFPENNPLKIHGKNSHASPSAVIDDDRVFVHFGTYGTCLLYTSPSPRDKRQSRMPSSA